MKQFFSNLFKTRDQRPPIIVVSGLPRSGTSLMMSMLAAGGLQVLTDRLRTADDDNPVGYFELEDVKKLMKGDRDWLADANGKAVKVISTLLPYLPDDHHYRIVFMRRAIEEVLASQRKMLINRGEQPDKISDEQISQMFKEDLLQSELWINSRSNVTSININYRLLMSNPKPVIAEINRYLGGNLNESQMLGTINPSLYRHRSS